MDQATLAAYSRDAAKFSDEWLGQPDGTDVHDLVTRFFISGGKTADIGCGNGRDAAWLSSQGYAVTGYDGSQALLEIASKNYPQIPFIVAHLPDLVGLQDLYQNVFCETVIMHLPVSEIGRAIQSLKRILEPQGTLYLSWRVTEHRDQRLPDGRLYSAFSSEEVKRHFAPGAIVHFEEVVSKSSGRKVCRLVARGESSHV